MIIHTNHSFRRYALACLMLGLAFLTMHLALAEDVGVCGDRVVAEGEQCDDGNLAGGDGCNALCIREGCGNGVREGDEQCDDGNVINGDGCTNICDIEYCGDGLAQEIQGEQCDDGNTVSDDGCSAECLLEDVEQSSSSSASEYSSVSSVASSSSSVQSSISSSLHSAAPKTQALPPVLTTLNSTVIRDALSVVSEKDMRELQTILNRIVSGAKLTEEEQRKAQELRTLLISIRDERRAQVVGILADLVRGVISEGVVNDASLNSDLLVQGSLEEIIKALEEKQESLSIENEEQLTDALNRLSLSMPSPSLKKIDALKYIAEQKKEAERIVDANRPSLTPEDRLQTIVDNRSLILAETGIDEAEFDRRMEKAKKNSADIADLMKLIDASLPKNSSLKPSAPAKPLMELNTEVKVDKETEKAFLEGDIAMQRSALLSRLNSDERIQALLLQAREDHQEGILNEWNVLLQAIERVGESDDMSTACDDSIEQALSCSHVTLAHLEETVRHASVFRSTVSTLQDFFFTK